MSYTDAFFKKKKLEENSKKLFDICRNTQIDLYCITLLKS